MEGIAGGQPCSVSNFEVILDQSAERAEAENEKKAVAGEDAPTDSGHWLTRVYDRTKNISYNA
jgi:hypothetical protein